LTLGDFAELYRMFAKLHRWTARQVDELELWEAAAYMGLDREPVVPTDPFDPRWGGHLLPQRLERVQQAAARRRT
jgi:hypothetical protein